MEAGKEIEVKLIATVVKGPLNTQDGKKVWWVEFPQFEVREYEYRMGCYVDEDGNEWKG